MVLREYRVDCREESVESSWRSLLGRLYSVEHRVQGVAGGA